MLRGAQRRFCTWGRPTCSEGRWRGDVDRGECESARCPRPVRDRINMNRQHAGCEENHHAEKYQAEYRVHPRQNDSQRNDSEENDEKYQ